MTRAASHRTAHVVVGVDRTGSHDHAILTIGLEQARRSGGDVCVVHAITTDGEPPGGPPDSTARRQQLATRHHRVQAVTADLRRQVAKLGVSGAVHYDVRYGDPATVILAAAQHADLIILGTHGSGGRRSPLLLGTVSQDIAVHATCPILLIPATMPTP
jgi:nucleotide-binding universal stress UspA family protein